MKQILVPCDFSDPAVNAFRFALDVAELSRGTVHLLHVIELPAVPNSAFTPVRALGLPQMREMSAEAKGKFSAVSKRYRKEGVHVISTVEVGIPSKAIVEYAMKKSIDLIVMGTHGVDGWKELFVGSNTEKIVRVSPVPVIVLKDLYKGPVKSIIFPNTLDTVSQEELVVKVKALQAFFKAHLHVVWINTPANFTPDTLTVERLNIFAKKFALKKFTLNVFNHSNLEEGIIRFTDSIGGDLIAMGTDGRKGLAHMMKGSTTEDVANHVKTLIWTSVMKKRR